MMKSIILLLFILASSNFALAEEVKIQLKGKLITLVDGQVERALLSADCRIKKRSFCLARKALQQAQFTTQESTDGQDPGTLICRHVGGHSIAVKTEKNLPITICQFQDASLTTTGSLRALAMQHEPKSRQK